MPVTKGSLIVLMAVILVFGTVILNSLDGVLIGTSTGNWDPFVKSLGGTFVANEQQVYNSAQKIQELQLNSTKAENVLFLDDTLDTLHRKVVFGMLITVLMLILLFIIFVKISPSSQIDLGGKMIALALAFVTLAAIQVMYSAFVEHTLVWPYQGTAFVITHTNVLASTLDYAQVGTGGYNASAFMNVSGVST